MTEIAYEIENAEDALDALTAQAESSPATWGAEKQAEADRLRANLIRLYEKHGVPADERVAL